MADSLISTLLEQLASITAREVQQEIRLVIGVDEEVRRLEGNLRTVLAVLDDAEKRQVKERAVSLWLEKLKEYYEEDFDEDNGQNEESNEDEVDEEFDEDDDQKEESNEDEVDEE
ncbi:hypothetical protein ACB094_03G008100 [Castanea mollissima]